MSEAGSKRVIAILTIALVMSLGVSGLMVGSFITGDFRLLDWLGFGSSGDSSGDEGGLKIDTNAGDYVVPIVNSNIEPNVAIPGWGRITIPSGTTEITSVDFYNPEENEGLYYLTFELLLPDGDKYISLYKSGAVPPGKHIQKITLNQTLGLGTYDALIHVQPYRINEDGSVGTPTNNANMGTTLVVI